MLSSRRRNLWRLSWIIAIPLLAIQLTWLTRTIGMYTDLGLRNLGDHRLNGMTLYQAGTYQSRYLWQEGSNALRRAVKRMPDDELPRLHLFVQERDLAGLDSALPISGTDYVDGKLFINGEFAPVKVRYRGDFAYHWGFFKPSLRIKTKRNNLFSGYRRFNLIIPKTAFLYSNHLGYEMARQLGVLAPKSELVYVNLNGRDRGFYLLVEQITESTLRNNSRLPGDIYKGDNLYGLDTWHGLETGYLFDSAGLWEKVAYNNHYAEDHRYPLEQLIEAVNRGDSEKLLSLVDARAFAKLNLWEQLGNTRHLDETHNWRLYFDPGRGRFYPVLWDGLPFSEQFLPPDWRTSLPEDPVIANRLMAELHRSGKFMDMRYRVFHDFFASDKPEQIIQLSEALNRQLADVPSRDPTLLGEGPTWLDPDYSRQRMKEIPEMLTTIISRSREQYSDPPVDIAESLVVEQWQGEILLTKSRVLDQPLSIAAGTRVRLETGVSLFIRNQVTIRGTADAPVIFEPAGPRPFGTIAIEGPAANGSTLSHFRISGGSGYKDELREYSGMLSIHDVQDIELSDCRLSDNTQYDDQLHVVYSTIGIRRCGFSRAPMDGVDLDMSSALISDVTFEDNGNDGLDLMGSEITADKLLFLTNGDKGISVGERSNLMVSHSRFTDNLIGIQVKDDSVTTGRDLTMTGNQVGVDASVKNWRYGAGGTVTLCGSSIQENAEPSRSDKRSSIQLLPECDIAKRAEADPASSLVALP